MTTHRLWPLPDAPLFSPLFFFLFVFAATSCSAGSYILVCSFHHVSYMRCGLLRFSSPPLGPFVSYPTVFFNICALWTGNIDAPHVQVPKSWHMARSVYRRARSKLEAFCLFIHLYYKSACIASVASIGSWVVRTAFYHSWMQGDKWACVRVVEMTIKQELVF